MARTASRYQRGLSYEPGMQGSRYAPTRASAELGQIGDYSGVAPIPGAVGDGGVVAPMEGGGNGLGSGTNMLAGLALTALTNPRVTDYAARLVRGDSTGGAAFNLGRPLDNGVTYGQLTGTPVRDGAGVTIEPMPTTTQNGVTFRELGAQQGGNAITGGARVLDNSLSYEQLMGLPYRPDPGVTIAPMSPTTGPGGVQFREVPWPDGGSSGVMDGGTSGIDFGVMDGSSAASEGGGGLFGNLFSLYGGLSGSPWLDAAGSLGGGALGSYVVSQTPMENGRDPLGKNIGAAVGAILGSPIPVVGPFLGAVIGGALGGQFGPQGTVGANWGGLNTWMPDGQGGGTWGYQSGADNGGQVNNPAAQQFQNALLALAQQRGYVIDPMSRGAAYTLGQYSGNGPNAPGAGWYYQPGAGQFEGIQRFFGNDLGAQSGGGYGIRPDGSIGTYGDAMINYAFQDLIGQGLFAPAGSVLTGDALQTALAERRAADAAGAASAYQASVTGPTPGGN